MSQIDKIFNFWFGRPDAAGYGKPRQIWFTADPEFDQEVRTRFMSDYLLAVQGQLQCLQESPRGCLALILLLDQFSRNMFRGTPQAFATDPQALAVAQHAIAQGFDRSLLVVQRWFIYLVRLVG